VVAAVALVAFGGCATGDSSAPASAPASGPAPPVPGSEPGLSLAVLPLDNPAGGAQDYFVAGVHEALITDLARTGSLLVISRGSAMRYEGGAQTATEIATELGVDRLVEGSVSRADGRVALTVRLIDGATGERLLEESYERDDGSVLVMLDEAARAIVAKIPGAERGQEAASPPEPVDPRAVDAFFRGRFHFNEGGVQGFNAARQQFRNAVSIDPSFGRAWSALAECYTMLGFFGMEPVSTTVPEARTAATRALDLDGQDGVARTVLGYLALTFDWDWAAAKRELEVALVLNSSNPFVHHLYADYLGLTGDVEASLQRVERGRRHDPFGYWANQVVIGHMFMARRYEETVEEGTRLLAIFPERTGIRSYIVVSLWKLGRYDEAVRHYQEGWGPGTQFVQTLTRAYLQDGPDAAMKARADEIAARSKMRPVDSLVVARYYAFGSEVDSAFDWLDRAVEERDPQLVHMLIDPRFDSIRSDPRYEGTLRRMGLPME
jgi:TolB-like protein